MPTREYTKHQPAAPGLTFCNMHEYWLWSGAEAGPVASFAQALHRAAGCAAAERPRRFTVICAETEEYRLLAGALPQCGWFAVDIGAAHGHATELLARGVGPTGAYLRAIVTPLSCHAGLHGF